MFDHQFQIFGIATYAICQALLDFNAKIKRDSLALVAVEVICMKPVTFESQSVVLNQRLTLSTETLPGFQSIQFICTILTECPKKKRIMIPELLA